MRLTLRTMLAYLDGVLEPADAETLGRQIDESETATGIVNRINDVVRRLRLAAPRISGRGLGLDPNTVAEYLDNTLPGERVPDFEKVCLESDVHLAEVAACHQVLTLVLGAPAEISPEMRDRMYSLAARIKTEPTGEAAAVADPPAAEPPVVHQATGESLARRKPEIPDYLRETRTRRFWPIAAAALVLVMLACVAVLAVGPQKLLALLSGDEPTTTAPATGATETDPAELNNEAGQPPPPEVDATAAPADPTEVAVDDHPNAIGTVPEDTADPSAPILDTTSAPSPDEDAAPVEPAGDVDLEEPPTPTGTAPGAEMPADEDPEAPPAPTPDDLPNPATGDVPADSVAPMPETIGRLVSDISVLLRAQDDGDWDRLPLRGTIAPGDRLLALPAFPATLTLGTGVNLDVLGASSVQLGPPDAEGLPQLVVQYGRAVLMPLGGDQPQVRLWAGADQGVLALADADSTVAIDVALARSPGVDPELEPSVPLVAIYVVRGSIAWQQHRQGEPVQVAAPARIMAGVAEPVSEFPEWLAVDTSPLIERRAAEFVFEHLQQDREIRLTTALKELVDHRRTEVQSLAVRCLAYLGEYAPLIAALHNDRQYASWNSQIESLQNAMARSPQDAAVVREALAVERGDDGQVLYRLLWGYTTSQLEEYAAEQLVGYLDHEDLDVRVLSFWNLQAITGETNYYRPDHAPGKRQTAVARWREKLERGEIVPQPVDAQSAEAEDAQQE